MNGFLHGRWTVPGQPQPMPQRRDHTEKLLPDEDSNLDQVIQSHSCYHYTIRHRAFPRLRERTDFRSRSITRPRSLPNRTARLFTGWSWYSFSPAVGAGAPTYDSPQEPIIHRTGPLPRPFKLYHGSQDCCSATTRLETGWEAVVGKKWANWPQPERPVFLESRRSSQGRRDVSLKIRGNAIRSRKESGI